jgi:hypothetical protein
MSQFQTQSLAWSYPKNLWAKGGLHLAEGAKCCFDLSEGFVNIPLSMNPLSRLRIAPQSVAQSIQQSQGLGRRTAFSQRMAISRHLGIPFFCLTRAWYGVEREYNQNMRHQSMVYAPQISSPKIRQPRHAEALLM